MMRTGGKRDTTGIVIVEDEDDHKNKETTRSDSKKRNKKRARRKGSQQQQHLLDSSEFRALFSLLMLLVVFVLVEILLIDTIFMGRGGSMAKLGLSDADYYISDSGALEEGLYLANANKHDKRKEEAATAAAAKPNKENRYGDSAVVVGLETCQQYRNKLEEEDEPSVAVLGLFQRVSSCSLTLCVLCARSLSLACCILCFFCACANRRIDDPASDQTMRCKTTEIAFVCTDSRKELPVDDQGDQSVVQDPRQPIFGSRRD